MKSHRIIKFGIATLHDPIIKADFNLASEFEFEEGVPYIFVSKNGRMGYKKVTLWEYIKSKFRNQNII